MINPSPEDQTSIQARLAAIVESSDDAIVSKTLEGIITSWNKGAERIFGYTAAEAVGKHMTLIFPEDRLSEEADILARLHDGDRVDHFETVRKAKDGRKVEVSVSISPIRDASGKIIGASKIARDITAQKEYERELQAAREAAEAANRSKDQFLSVLSHELRTPLTPVLAAVSLLESTPLPQEALREQLGMIRRNLETEARLVDDLLDITRISRGNVRLHFEVVDAHAAIRNVVSMLQAEIDEKQLAITIALRAKEYQLWADPGRFQQILLNLISNAIKFTPEAGSITVQTENDGSDRLKINLSDTGIGIAADYFPRLFEPFEQGERTVTRRYSGLGLGLSIVRSLVEMHGGSVTATSAGTGMGSTFSLRMQTVSRERQTTQTTSRDVAQPNSKSGRRRRILLVEDHADTRQLLTLLLRSFGCEVKSAATVREAIELANTQDFDLLLSDIGLPDGSGMDVMRYVRERKKIKGIALSGFGRDDDMRRSLEAGFEQHLIKPINLATLREVILRATG